MTETDLEFASEGTPPSRSPLRRRRPGAAAGRGAGPRLLGGGSPAGAAGAEDAVTPTEQAEAAFARAGEPKRLVHVPGGHFDVYLGQGFDRAMGASIA